MSAARGTADRIGLAELRPLELFAGTPDDQLRELAEAGSTVTYAAGDDLFREGEPADFWWVLVSGCVELVRRVGREDSVVGAMDVPGRWAGGFRTWDEHGVYLATGRAVRPGRMLRVPAGSLRTWSADWFPFGAHLIEGLFRTARAIEAGTRRREALVALGTLAAGLAHEVNNPAAAAARAAAALADEVAGTRAAAVRLAGALDAAQLAAVEALLADVGPVAAADPLAAADREDALADWLSGHGVERAWELAATLSGAGLDVAWCDRVLGISGADALEPALRWAAGTVATTALLTEVGESTRRISDLVGAVKSYTQMDRASLRFTDVAEGVDATLVVLAHRIPPGVTVVRDDAPGLPGIEAVAAELNQVWTHLVDNALDALAGTGTLRISVRPYRDGVEVEVADTGAGLTREAREHAFDPFFTTKGVGGGVGLGLDVCRRIVVDGHGGDIGFDPRPGETVVRVRLPGRARPARP